MYKRQIQERKDVLTGELERMQHIRMEAMVVQVQDMVMDLAHSMTRHINEMVAVFGEVQLRNQAMVLRMERQVMRKVLHQDMDRMAPMVTAEAAVWSCPYTAPTSEWLAFAGSHIREEAARSSDADIHKRSLMKA